MYTEDIDNSLKEIAVEFDNFCKEHGLFYDITTDEPRLQRYFVKDKNHQELETFIKDKCKPLGIHCDVSSKRGGVSFSFSLKAIADSWQVLPKNPTRADMSSFIDKRDAIKVRQKKTMYQKVKSEMCEMIAPQIERPSHIGLTQPDRVPFPTNQKDAKITTQRTDLTDVPNQMQKIMDKENNNFDSSDLDKEFAGIEDEIQFEDHTPVDTLDRGVDPLNPVVPDDETSRMNNSKYVLDKFAGQQNIMQLSASYPNDGRHDNRQAAGGPMTNVGVEHPPDRSFDANQPKIRVHKAKAKLPVRLRDKNGSSYFSL